MKAIIVFLTFLAASAPPNDRETADFGGQFLVREDSEQLRITNTSGYQLEPGVITPAEYMGLVRSLTEREQVGLGVETDIYRQAGSRIGCGVLFSGWLADWTEGEVRPLFVSGGLNYLFMAGTSPVRKRSFQTVID